MVNIKQNDIQTFAEYHIKDHTAQAPVYNTPDLANVEGKTGACLFGDFSYDEYENVLLKEIKDDRTLLEIKLNQLKHLNHIWIVVPKSHIPLMEKYLDKLRTYKTEKITLTYIDEIEIKGLLGNEGTGRKTHAGTHLLSYAIVESSAYTRFLKSGGDRIIFVDPVNLVNPIHSWIEFAGDAIVTAIPRLSHYDYSDKSIAIINGQIGVIGEKDIPYDAADEDCLKRPMFAGNWGIKAELLPNYIRMSWNGVEENIKVFNSLTKVNRPVNTQWLENLENVECFVNHRLAYLPYYNKEEATKFYSDDVELGKV